VAGRLVALLVFAAAFLRVFAAARAVVLLAAPTFLAALVDLFAARPVAAFRRAAGAGLGLEAFRAFFGLFTKRALDERLETLRAARLALRLEAPRLFAARADLLLAMANPFRLKSRVPTIYLDSACPLA
jgi:hypothetical protein